MPKGEKSFTAVPPAIPQFAADEVDMGPQHVELVAVCRGHLHLVNLRFYFIDPRRQRGAFIQRHFPEGILLHHEQLPVTAVDPQPRAPVQYGRNAFQARDQDDDQGNEYHQDPVYQAGQPEGQVTVEEGFT